MAPLSPMSWFRWYAKEQGRGVVSRDMNLHALPWPKEELEVLQDAKVQMRVTLSYFVEPNPSARGAASKFHYGPRRRDGYVHAVAVSDLVKGRARLEIPKGEVCEHLDFSPDCDGQTPSPIKRCADACEPA